MSEKDKSNVGRKFPSKRRCKRKLHGKKFVETSIENREQIEDSSLSTEVGQAQFVFFDDYFC